MEQIPPVVLCVEDDDDTREMLRMLLEDRGYIFKAVGNCAEALKFIREGSASFVLLDNWLPDGSGIEVCRQVRQFDKRLPIVFFSGAAFETECIAAGASGFITKPCRLEELFSVLAELIPIPERHLAGRERSPAQRS